MSNLTDNFENRVARYVNEGVTPAALTTPIQVQLLSALGSGDTPGTPVAGAVEDYGATTTGDTSSNAAIVRYEGLANPTTVAGFQIQDSAGTPVPTQTNIPRTGGSVSVTDGVFEIPAGGLTSTAS